MESCKLKVESLKRLKSGECRVKNLHIQLWRNLFNIDFDTSPLFNKVNKRLSEYANKQFNKAGICENSSKSLLIRLIRLFTYSPIRLQRAFTLAEVLITLGIIGVVAAMTMPVLIQKYNNMVVETRLKKVYTVMNQAIQMAEAEYGAKELWDFSDPNFWDKYFAPYLKVLKTDIVKKTGYKYRLIYFSDGSLLIGKYTQMKTNSDGEEYEEINAPYGSNKDYYFYPNAKNFDNNTFDDSLNDMGKSLFTFRFAPQDSETLSVYQNRKGFQPYSYLLNKDLSNLLEGSAVNSCNKEAQYPSYCTYYIYQNGWKIPDNYPFKVR